MTDSYKPFPDAPLLLLACVSRTSDYNPVIQQYVNLVGAKYGSLLCCCIQAPEGSPPDVWRQLLDLLRTLSEQQAPLSEGIATGGVATA